MRGIFRAEHVFPLVIGLTDGILTALTLASGRVLNSSEPITTGLALRISAASSVSGVFVFFTAEYIRLRGGLVHVERELSLASRGHLAVTRLGMAILRETVWGAAISSACNFVGALLPLLAGALLPTFSWVAVAVGLLALGVLGLVAARSIYGSPIIWVVALILAGGVLTLVGLKLRIV
jgi:VIT1/CCC1 family predicted Fe2+/Mn2+ transporter